MAEYCLGLIRNAEKRNWIHALPQVLSNISKCFQFDRENDRFILKWEVVRPAAANLQINSIFCFFTFINV